MLIIFLSNICCFVFRGDQRTISGFLHHFLRREYGAIACLPVARFVLLLFVAFDFSGTFQLAADQTDDPGMWSRLKVYWRVLLAESLYVTPFLALAGLASILRSRLRFARRSGQVLLCSYALYMLVFHYLANLNLNPLFLGVQARFWQQV